MRFGRIILGIVSWIPFLVVFIFVSIPICVLFLYKLLLTTILRRIFRRDLVSPITMLDHLFCFANFWDRPLGNISFVSEVDGHLDSERVCARLSDVVEHYRLNSKKKTPNCDRLTSVYPSFWMGYPFWTKVKGEFNVRDHVRILANNKEDAKKIDVNQALVEWVSSPFKRNTPLWDVLIITGVQNGQAGIRSYFGFRIQHAIGDGFSMQYFMDKLFDECIQEPLPLKEIKPKNFNFMKLFWLPLAVFGQFQGHLDYFSTRKSTSKLSIAMSTVKLDELKTIRRQLSFKIGAPVTFNAMLAFILGATVRKAFANGDLVGDVKTLKDLNVACGLPRNTPHPKNEFCNHVTFAHFTVPLKSERSSDNLKKTVRHFSDKLEIHGFEILTDFQTVYSVLPRCILQPLLLGSPTTIAIGNIPGPPQPVHLGGKRVTQTYLLPAQPAPHASFGIAFYSYNNQVFITLVANEEVFDTTLAEKLVSKYLMEEVKNLLENGIGDETCV